MQDQALFQVLGRRRPALVDPADLFVRGSAAAPSRCQPSSAPPRRRPTADTSAPGSARRSVPPRRGSASRRAGPRSPQTRRTAAAGRDSAVPQRGHFGSSALYRSSHTLQTRYDHVGPSLRGFQGDAMSKPDDLPPLRPGVDVGLGLELADAEPPHDGDRVFFVPVAQQPQRRRLRGELVAGQDAELGQPPQRIARRAVIGVLAPCWVSAGMPSSRLMSVRGPHRRIALLEPLGELRPPAAATPGPAGRCNPQHAESAPAASPAGP